MKLNVNHYLFCFNEEVWPFGASIYLCLEIIRISLLFGKDCSMRLKLEVRISYENVV